MKSTVHPVITVALIAALAPATALASANCQHSHSWQCQGQLSSSGTQSQTTGAGIATSGSTANPGTTNPVLGTGSSTTAMVALLPATPIVAPNKPKMVKPAHKQGPQAPPITNPNQAPGLTVNPIPTPTFTGFGKRPTPQIIAIQAPPLTGTGKVPGIVTGQTPPPIVGGNQQPPVVVKPLPSPTLVGQGKVPTVVGTLPPPITGYGPVPPQTGQALVPPPIVGGNAVPPIIVNPLQAPTLVGQGKVPTVVGTQAPPIIGQGQLPAQKGPAQVPPPSGGNQAPPTVVTPLPTPVIVGQGQVPGPTVVKAPPITSYGKVPGKPKIKTPPLAPQPLATAQPYLIPPQGSATPSPVKGSKVPHRTHNVPNNVSQPQTSTPAGTSGNQGGGPSHWIVSAQPRAVDGTTQKGAQQIQGEVVEPGIQNKNVRVYRSEDATETVYKDVIPMDKTGFHLTVVGIREPHFNQPKAQLPTVESEHYVFFFDYASVEIYREQLYLIDEIAQRYRDSGERVIVMGETDGFGSQEYNVQLAIHRSNKIIDQLLAAGVPADDIEFKVLVRCCRIEAPTQLAVASTEDQRITWVTFQNTRQ